MLWLLTRTDISYEYHGLWTKVDKLVCARAKLVRADTEAEARHLANECIYACGSQGISKPNDDQIWNDPDLVHCTEIESTDAKGILLLK